MSHSNRQVKVWSTEQLYTQSALIGGRALFLKGTSHPLLPLRILAACSDQAVRVVGPGGGCLITTALLPTESQTILSLAYFPFDGECVRLFVCV